MTKVQQLHVKKDAQLFLSRSSLTSLGQRANVGTKPIRDLLNEKFEELNEQLLNKINAVVKTGVGTGLYRTNDCTAFLNATEQATRHQLMIGITGNTGTGKTFMSEAIAKKENVLYWNCHLQKSPKVFFQELLSNMNVPYGTKSISEMIDRAARAMNEYGYLLIIDECDKMHRHIRGCVHTLRDRTRNHCGIVLVGMPALKNDLLRGKEAGKPGYSEFWRRVNIWHHLGGLQPDEIKKVLHDEGITAPDVIREFRHYTSFGELVNAIQLHKILNN